MQEQVLEQKMADWGLHMLVVHCMLELRWYQLEGH